MTKITGVRLKLFINGIELQQTLTADPMQSKLVTFLYKLGIKSAGEVMCTIDMNHIQFADNTISMPQDMSASNLTVSITKKEI